MYSSTCCCRSVKPCMDGEPTEQACPCQIRSMGRTSFLVLPSRSARKSHEKRRSSAQHRTALAVESRGQPLGKRALASCPAETMPRVLQYLHVAGRAVGRDGDHDGHFFE